MLAICALPESDLLCAIPRGLANIHAKRFGLACVDAPLPLPRWRLPAVVQAPAMMDLGVVWLLETIARVAKTVQPVLPRRRR